MTPPTRQAYLAVAEAAWRWVLDQVRWDDGPWIPASVTVPEVTEPHGTAMALHSGVGGLAHVLAEIRLGPAVDHRGAEPGGRDRRSDPRTDPGPARLHLLRRARQLRRSAHRAGGPEARRLPWPGSQRWPTRRLAADLITQPGYCPGARINDLTLGTAGVLLGAIWARRHGVAGAADVAEHAAAVLLAEAEHEPTGTNWQMVPPRFGGDTRNAAMPNLSHGLAGIAAALALAGVELDRPDLTAAARSGAEHLVSLGDARRHGFVVPRYLPRDFNDQDEITYTWCHGATGTALLFLALDRAGVPEVAGEAPLSWHRRCLHSVRTSGLPARLHPGFWDNDGRCCGTAGVGEVFLDAWHRSGDDQDLEFALHLADTLAERAVREGPHAYWRFIEHHAAEPLLPPGVGWMQGAAGIAAFLYRVSRVVQDGRKADPVPRMDTWWALPSSPAQA